MTLRDSILALIYPTGAVPFSEIPRFQAVSRAIDVLLAAVDGSTLEEMPSCRDHVTTPILERIEALYLAQGEHIDWAAISAQINTEYGFHPPLSHHTIRKRYYKYRSTIRKDRIVEKTENVSLQEAQPAQIETPQEQNAIYEDAPQKPVECSKTKTPKETTNDTSTPEIVAHKNPSEASDDEIEAEIIRLCQASADKRLNGKADLHAVTDQLQDRGINRTFYHVRQVWATEGLRRRAAARKEAGDGSEERKAKVLAEWHAGKKPMEIAGYLTVPLDEVWKIIREEHAQ